MCCAFQGYFRPSSIGYLLRRSQGGRRSDHAVTAGERSAGGWVVHYRSLHGRSSITTSPPGSTSFHGEPAATQQRHPDERAALGLVDRDEALSAAPEYASVVDAQGGGATVGEFDLHEAAPRQGQGPDHVGGQRQVAGEAGVYHGLHLNAGTSRAEYREGYDSLSTAGDHASAHRCLCATGCGSLG